MHLLSFKGVFSDVGWPVPFFVVWVLTVLIMQMALFERVFQVNYLVKQPKLADKYLFFFFFKG